jgi:hypothetical protein
MGTIKQGILGAFSGKVGTVIGGVWKGIAYMRGLQTSASRIPTEAQLNTRAKFALTMTYLKPMSQFLQAGFKNLAVHMSGINAATSYNYRNAITGAYPAYTIDPTKVLVASGTLAPPLNAVATSALAGTVKFDWEDNSGEISASALDSAMIVINNPVKHTAVSSIGLSDRTTGTQTATVPDSWSGDSVQCFLAFNAADGFTNSNSVYAGSVPVV